jgi:uncharacterized protein YecA (UPF0149 family)
MNQPENNAPTGQEILTAPPSQEEWLIQDELLSCRVNKEAATSQEIVPDEKLKWFQMVVQGGETEIEKSEMIEAQKQQLRMGIIKLPPQAQQKQQQQRPASAEKIQGTVIPVDILNGIGKPTVVQKPKKLGPNDKCSCGSGRKFKVCCMHKQFLK